jgi:hypothetical protein
LALVIADLGLQLRMLAMIGDLNDSAVTFRLFKSNTTPTKSTIIGDMTECDFSGYSSVDAADWALLSLTGHVQTIEADDVVFSHDGGGTANDVYGYYVTDPGNSFMYWSERFPSAPVNMGSSGQSITVSPRMTDESKYP